MSKPNPELHRRKGGCCGPRLTVEPWPKSNDVADCLALSQQAEDIAKAWSEYAHKRPIVMFKRPAADEMSRVYLASPYTYKSRFALVRWVMKRRRFVQAVRAVCWLSKHYPRKNVFSPIVHSHPLAMIGKLRGDWAFWKHIDTDFITRSSDEFVVLTIPGWQTSSGVTDELNIAQSVGLPISYLIPRGQSFILSATPPQT